MLEVTNLSVAYGGLRALTDVTLSVKAGQFVTVVGPNGAGKSTLFKAISGIVPPVGGQITFLGQDLLKLSAAQRAHLGIAHVPEGRQVFKTLTVRENLEMGAFTVRNPALVRERMDQGLELFPRLKERLGQFGGTLSGGEQQMLAIARGLMMHPRLLMLDEPSMGLAPVLVELIFDIIKMLNDQGTTILLVEQNALMALAIAHRGCVLQNGEIVLSDTAINLRKNESVQQAYLGVS